MKYWLPSIFGDENELRNLMTAFNSLPFKNESGLSVYEDANKIYVEAALPGIPSKDIEISCEDNIVWIKGEAKEERKDVKVHVKSSQSYSYRFQLPSPIDEKAIPEAAVKDGILKISFKKSKETKGKKIQIKVK